MIKYYLATVLLVFTGISYAGYGVGEIKRFFVTTDGWVYFGLVNQLPNTCNYYGEHFKFDTSTVGGKNLLSVVMSAKLANRPVAVWYTESPSPGTNHTNGCTGNELSTLSNLGIP